MSVDVENLTSCVVLCEEPLQGYTPKDVQKWIEEQGVTDQAIAAALAAVNGKVGWLDDELYDYNEESVEYKEKSEEYESWWALYNVLVEKIISRLKEMNRTKGTCYKTDDKGLHYIIEPFMEMNGYCNASGWWIKK